VPKKTSTSSILSVPSSVQSIYKMQKEAEESQLKPTPMIKIFMFSPNWFYWGVGLLGCILSGVVTPFFAIVYGQIVSVFSEPVENLVPDARFWSAMFVLVGILSGIGFFTSANMLGRCGEALTKKLRYEAFRNLMRQDIG
jgi:hypothetical protein